MEIKLLEGDNSILVLWEIVLRRYMLKCLSIKCHDACNLFLNVSKKACVCVCAHEERKRVWRMFSVGMNVSGGEFWGPCPVSSTFL